MGSKLGVGGPGAAMSEVEKAQYCSFDRHEEVIRRTIDAETVKPVAGGAAIVGGALKRILRGKPSPPAAEFAPTEGPALPREPTVFGVELKAIRARRALNGLMEAEPGANKNPQAGSVGPASGRSASEIAVSDPETADPTTAHKLTGLCLSGGGLRSAAFSLGALQALFFHCGKRSAKGRSDLPMIDYISSVSGGGYMAACMSLGMTRSGGEFPFGDANNGSTETSTTRHLRDNSRYLLAGGIVSFIFVYLRGVIAGLMCILPPLIAVAAILALFFHEPRMLETPPWAIGWFKEAYVTSYIPVISFAAICAMALLALLAVVVSLFSPFQAVSARRRFAAIVGAFLGVPLLVVLVLEGHVALLRAYFVSDGTLFGPEGGVSFLSVTAGKLRDWAQTVAPFFFALTALALPFIKRIAESAAQTTQTTYSAKFASVLSRITLPVLAIIVPFLLWLLMMVMAITMIEKGYFLFEKATPTWWLPGAIAVFLVSYFLIDYNANSLHNIYRDRMSRAFLASGKALAEKDSDKRKELLNDDDRIALSEISTDHTPYHLINTALNIPGSAWANQRGRNADFFIYSPKFIGGELTGYIDTKSAESRVSTFNLGTAMAVSGAAVAPNMGMLSVRLMSITLAVLNLRLGRWAANPRRLKDASEVTYRHFPGARHFLREAFNKTGIGSTDNGKGEAGAAMASGANKPFVYLSDGGHIENLGAYELLRRRCRLVICVDGERDPDISAGALAQLERFARIDLGVRLHIDVTPIAIGHQAASWAMSKETEPLKQADAQAGPHVALGVIDYPAVPGGPGAEIGAFLYVKSSLSGDENAYVAAYKAEHPAFPHETTGDQFFTEEQFECYRALGEHILRRALKGQDLVTLPVASTDAKQRAAVIKIVQESLPGTKLKWSRPNAAKPAAQPSASSKPSTRKRAAEAAKAARKVSPEVKVSKPARTKKS